MLQSCFPCRNVLCRLSANVLGTKDMPLQTQHSLFLLEFSGSLKELVLGRYVDGFRKILPFLQLIFFLYLCRQSHTKCNHCVPDVIKASPFYPLAKWFLCKKWIPHTYRYEY